MREEKSQGCSDRAVGGWWCYFLKSGACGKRRDPGVIYRMLQSKLIRYPSRDDIEFGVRVGG